MVVSEKLYVVPPTVVTDLSDRSDVNALFPASVRLPPLLFPSAIAVTEPTDMVLFVLSYVAWYAEYPTPNKAVDRTTVAMANDRTFILFITFHLLS